MAKRKQLKNIDLPKSTNKIFIPEKVNPKTPNQDIYVKSIYDNVITICSGPAGSGKSRLGIAVGIDLLRKGAVEKIVLSRSILEAGAEKLGFLPGSSNDKLLPYVQPVLIEMENFCTKEEVEQWRVENKIEILPIAHMRGRSWHNSYVLIDEAQNATFEQLLMIITRLGQHSKIVMTCDVKQSDLPKWVQGAVVKFMEKLEGMKGVGIVRLHREDILRSPFIAEILERLEI